MGVPNGVCITPVLCEELLVLVAGKLAVTWISSGTSLGDPVKILPSSERDCRPWPSVAPGLVSKFDASDEGRSMHATSKLL